MRTFLLIVGLLFFQASFAAERMDSGDGYILSCANFSYIVSAPKEWKVIETNFADIVFFPAKYTYDKTPVMIYTRSVQKAELGIHNTLELNAFDLKGMKEQWSAIQSLPTESMSISNQSKIPTYSFSGGQFLETVAYADQPKTITVIVLSAENEASLSESIPAFRSFVGSYQWVTDVAESK